MDISPALIYNYPTISSISEYLAGKTDKVDTNHHIVFEKKEKESEPIAIIGLECKFPGGSNYLKFEQYLVNGVDSISQIPNVRWEYDTDTMRENKFLSRHGGFIKDADKFDANFFNITFQEARIMDPQQRILLETTYHAIENANIKLITLSETTTGVFIGICSNDYSKILADNHSNFDLYIGLGNAHSIAANRISYYFNLNGPSFALDSACSSSLVAIHQAVQSLRSGECKYAIAGGINLMFIPEIHIIFSKSQMLSKDCKCKTFSNNADGYVRGEGCGIVVLKSLKDAERDNDNILGVIKGSAINQDGLSNGITAPNGNSQEQVISKALQDADCKPEEISYIESHGTGTHLGDPIEVKSLANIYNSGNLFYLGSVKTNIGHLEGAAGVAGFIKTVSMLNKKVIYPNLIFSEHNEHIPWDTISYSIPQAFLPWHIDGETRTKRRAGVSSFGFGGTNSRVILEEYVPKSFVHNKAKLPHHALFSISAKSNIALYNLSRKYIEYLENKYFEDLHNICFTHNSFREQYDYNLTFKTDSVATTIKTLKELSIGEMHSFKSKENARLAFVFSGDDTQFVGMAHDLYSTIPYFKECIDRCDVISSQFSTISIKDILYNSSISETLIHLPLYSLPIIFSIQYAISMLLMKLGIYPQLVMGHGLGEICAGCITKVISLNHAMELIYINSSLEQKPDVKGKAQNAVEYKFFNAMKFNNSNIDYYSAIYEEKAIHNILHANHWLIDIWKSTQKEPTFTNIPEKANVIIEISPKPILTDKAEGIHSADVHLLKSMSNTENNFESLIDILEVCNNKKVGIDFGAIYEHGTYRKMILPAYAFEKIRYWPGDDSEIDIEA